MTEIVMTMMIIVSASPSSGVLLHDENPHDQRGDDADDDDDYDNYDNGDVMMTVMMMMIVLASPSSGVLSH